MTNNLPDPFMTDLVLTWLRDRFWQTYQEFVVMSKILGLIRVRIRFVTDGPSIPKYPVIYEEDRDRAWPAAVPHDFLYDKTCPIVCTREQADEVFHELMDALYPGWIDRVKNDTEFQGVRVGGESHFRK